MIPRQPVPAVLAAALGVLLTTTAHAGPPSPSNSFVDPCIRVCPGGDMNFHVVVRDLNNNPVGGSLVVVDFGSCQIVLCPPLPTDPYSIVPPNSILMATNPLGIADIPIRAGGVCAPESILVFADGVLLAIRTSVASPDQDGNLTVNAVDNGILTAKLLGPYDPTADLNCSGALEPGDPGVFGFHVGHNCQAVVPVIPRSWGTVKVIYR